MRYTPMETQQLAYALFQLESAKQSGVNETFNRNFEARLGNAIDSQVRFNSEGDIELARFRNEKVGRGSGKGDRVEIKGALKNLQGTDAQKPYYAAVAGEPAPRARFLRPEAYGMPNDEIMERYPKYGEDMIGVRDRFQRDVLLGERPPQNDSFAQAQHALDREFEARGRSVELDKEAVEIGELARLQKQGRLQMPDASQLGGGVGRRENPDGVPMGIPSGRKQNAAGKQVMIMGRPEENNNIRQAGGRMPVNISQKQPIQEAPVPSIAPTPGDITGNQASPTSDAGRGGWMGGDNKGRVVSNPFEEERKARTSSSSSSGPKDLTPELRKQLFSLPGPEQGPDLERNPVTTSGEAFEPGTFQGRVDRRAAQAENIRTNPKYQRGRRIGYGAAAAAGVAGLASLISGERNQREEEQY
jgi:hypothetical protein